MVRAAGFRRLPALVLLLGLLWAAPAAARVLVGIVPGAASLLPQAAQADLLAGYLQRQLGEELTILTFAGTEELSAWRRRNPQLEVAILRLDRVGRQDGRLFRLGSSAQTGRPEVAGADLAVFQERLQAGLLVRLQEALVGLEGTAAGRQLLDELGLAGILPPGSDSTADRVAPTVVPPPASPPGLGLRDLLREAPPEHTVYVAPFTTIMVPGAVAESVFDEFVDRLNAAGAEHGYGFVILKGGLPGADPDWLARQTVVTGDLFGYVEDSGCCSTEIRARARIGLRRPESSAPPFSFDYPQQVFFDHDRSTLDRERSKLAGRIAATLAEQVLQQLLSP